eukprot:NODE_780_length_4291_cov_0.447758.p3 type:complete len:119 gc:universal NODE_780_length_4291_cov_0.447758:2170-1814(-)
MTGLTTTLTGTMRIDGPLLTKTGTSLARYWTIAPRMIILCCTGEKIPRRNTNSPFDLVQQTFASHLSLRSQDLAVLFGSMTFLWEEDVSTSVTKTWLRKKFLFTLKMSKSLKQLMGQT